MSTRIVQHPSFKIQNVNGFRACCCYKGWGLQYHAQLALEARGHVPNADDGSAFVRFGTDSELLIYVSSQLLFLRAEHLDVGFMLSGSRRRHKVSQRSVRVLERLPRRERRVSKGAPERERLGLTARSGRGRCGASCEARRVHPPGRARRGGGVHGVHELRRGV